MRTLLCLVLLAIIIAVANGKAYTIPGPIKGTHVTVFYTKAKVTKEQDKIIKEELNRIPTITMNNPRPKINKTTGKEGDSIFFTSSGVKDARMNIVKRTGLKASWGPQRTHHDKSVSEAHFEVKERNKQPIMKNIAGKDLLQFNPLSTSAQDVIPTGGCGATLHGCGKKSLSDLSVAGTVTVSGSVVVDGKKYDGSKVNRIENGKVYDRDGNELQPLTTLQDDGPLLACYPNCPSQKKTNTNSLAKDDSPLLAGGRVNKKGQLVPTGTAPISISDKQRKSITKNLAKLLMDLLQDDGPLLTGAYLSGNTLCGPKGCATVKKTK